MAVAVVLAAVSAVVGLYVSFYLNVASGRVDRPRRDACSSSFSRSVPGPESSRMSEAGLPQGKQSWGFLHLEPSGGCRSRRSEYALPNGQAYRRSAELFASPADPMAVTRERRPDRRPGLPWRLTCVTWKRGAGHDVPGATRRCYLATNRRLVFRRDGQLRLGDDVVARRHDLGVEGHADHHVGERLRHERQDRRIVVVEVVAPPERVVDAAAVEARDVALEVAEEPAEQVDLLLASCSSPARSARRWPGCRPR